MEFCCFFEKITKKRKKKVKNEKYDKFFNQITAGIAEKNYDEKLLEQLKDMQIIEVGQDEIMLTDLGEKVLEFRKLTK